LPDLQIFLLGAPRVERDRAPVHMDTRKALALLAYLAISGRRHTRDDLAALLWPDYDDSSARGALRRTLATLNGALQGEGLLADRESIQFTPTPRTWVDVLQFRALLARSRAQEAAALYAGDFLAGFSVRESPEFQSWQFAEAEALRRELAAALEGLVRQHAAQGEFTPATEYAHRWLSLDSLQEAAHRALMRLFAWSGDRSAAIRQYRECVRILERELGVPPVEETVQLYEMVKENRLALPSPAPVVAAPKSASPAPSGPASPVAPAAPAALAAPAAASRLPLVGRSAEWRRLQECYRKAPTEGHLAVLEGEAGIGKTRMAEEFIAAAQREGAVVLAGRCYEGEAHLAYGLIIGLLRQVCRHRDWLAAAPSHCLAEAARLLPELRPETQPLPITEGLTARTRLLDSTSELLSLFFDQQGGGILYLEDLHWADPASVELLSYLVRRLRGRPLFSLFTWRPTEVTPESGLHRLLAHAQRGGWATLIPLGRLGREAVAELVAAAQLPAHLGEPLFQETEGLPFFLVEYLAALPAGGDWTLPPTARDLLRSRLAAAGEVGMQLLTTAAVIGRSFDLETLREASGRSEEETLAALEGLVATGLVREAGAGGADGRLCYEFYHAKLGALLYEEVGLARRRLLHRRVAQVLAGQAERSRDRGALYPQVAHHFEQAREDLEAARYHDRAGQHTRALHANRQALSHCSAALALGHPDAARLHEAIGDLQRLEGEYQKALQSYEAAAAHSEDGRLPYLEQKLGNLYDRLGEWDLAESHYESALAHLDGAAGARVLADWSLTAYRRGQTARAEELAQRTHAMAAADGDPATVAQACNIRGILARSRGDLTGAQELLGRSLELASLGGDLFAQAAALNNLALVCGDTGHNGAAISLAERALALCRQLGDLHHTAALCSNLADLHHAGGQSDRAMAFMRESAAILARIGAEASIRHPEIWKLTEW
jgi:DNA-binding SARP family transcriptional activator